MRIAVLFPLLAASEAAPMVRPLGALPEMMLDFEVNQETGDLAAVEPLTNKAYLFHYEDLQASNSSSPSAYKVAEVCKTPVSISYKMYEGDGYYAVVCTEEATIRVLDETSFEEKGVVSTGYLGVSRIISSKSSQDPFYYFIVRTGSYDSALHAFDVRTMLGRGAVSLNTYDDIYDAAISADGDILYTRESWSSSSGCQSHQIESGTTSLTRVPSFTEIYHHHNLNPPCVPDARGILAAAGTNVLSASLKQDKGRLDFTAETFGVSDQSTNETQIIFGLAHQRGRYSYSRSHYTGISAASSDDFKALSDNATFPHGFLDQPIDGYPSIPTGIDWSSSSEHLTYQRELIAVDGKQLLFLGHGRNVSFIPYACFHEGAEPKLNTTKVYMGRGEQTIKLNGQAASSIAFKDLPNGVTFDEQTQSLHWLPSDSQSGDHVLQYEISHGDEGSCYYSMTINIDYPAMKLPINPQHFVVNHEESLAVAYAQGPSYSDPTTLVLMALDANGSPEASSFQTMELDFNPSGDQVLISANRVLVFTSRGSNAAHVYVYDTADLSEIGQFFLPFSLSSSATELSIDGDTNTLKAAHTSDKRVLSYDLETLALIDDESFYYVSTMQVSEAYLYDHIPDLFCKYGVLYNTSTLEPSIILDAGPFKLPGQSSRNTWPGWAVGVPKFLRNSPIVSLIDRHVQMEVNQVNGQNYAYEASVWILDDNGIVQGTKTLQPEVEEEDRSSSSSHKQRHTLTAGTNHIYITFQDHLYWFQSSDLKEGGGGGIVASSTQDRLRFLGRQSEFCLRGSGDVWELKHTVLGGEPPYDFLMGTHEQLYYAPMYEHIDNSDGTIQLNASEWTAEATMMLAENFRKDPEALFAGSRKESEPSAPLVGCLEQDEIPVSLDINLKVIDQNGDVASIGYYVIIPVPLEDAMAVLETLPDNPYEEEEGADAVTAPLQQNCTCAQENVQTPVPDAVVPDEDATEADLNATDPTQGGVAVNRDISKSSKEADKTSKVHFNDGEEIWQSNEDYFGFASSGTKAALSLVVMFTWLF